jgi:SnoaL-like polyketide cyclase
MHSSIENLVFASTPGPQIVAAEMELYRSLYEGLRFNIERMFTEGNTVVTVWQASGTSKDETFVNRAGKTEPKSLRAEGVSLTEAKDGKIAAHRFLWPRSPLFL